MSVALTLAVCTHDRPHYLDACLSSLVEHASGPGRPSVIVVDSASSVTQAPAIAALAKSYGARLLRLERTGLSAARNAALEAARTEWIAYIDDDATVGEDWLRAIRHAIDALPPGGAALGGAIRPRWEAPCPAWWPPELMPALTILEWGRPGQVGDGELPAHVEPYGANMAFCCAALRAIGGFPEDLGRVGKRLLSGEEAWVLRSVARRGHTIHYDPAIVVEHSIQEGRLDPRWLISRQFWSGASEAIMLAKLGQRGVLRTKGRRLAAQAAALAPLALWPSSRWQVLGRSLFRHRCSLAFAAGFLRGMAAVGWPGPGMFPMWRSVP